MVSRREVCILFGGVALSAAALGQVSAAPDPGRAAGDTLPRRTPHDVGVDADAVMAWLDAMEAGGVELNSFMVARQGAVAAEGWWWPYQPNFVHMLHSATKSFTGTGVGLAIGEGRLKLDDPVLKFFPGRVSAPSANLQAMTVESLLTQTSGHAHGISGSSWRPLSTSWIDEFFKTPVEYPPGTHFAYSSATSFMLSAIVTRATGQSLADYMRPRFFEPTGMLTPRWDVGPEGVNPGGNGLSTTTADFLKLGLVHLAGGQWNGRQVLPRAWTQAVTRPAHGHDYSYQWWLSPQHDCYFAAGKFGQFCFVFPGLDAVLAFTSGASDLLETRELIHRLALSHMPRICPPKANAAGEAALARRIPGLRVLPALTPKASDLTAKISGREVVCIANADKVARLKLTFDDAVCRFEMTDERGTHVIENGLTDWRRGVTSMTGHYLHHEYEPAQMPVFAGGWWASPRRFDMAWQFVESGFRDTASVYFGETTEDGYDVEFHRGTNVNSGPLQRPVILGVLG